MASQNLVTIAWQRTWSAVRSVSGLRHKGDSRSRLAAAENSLGFTLIELLVVIADHRHSGVSVVAGRASGPRGQSPDEMHEHAETTALPAQNYHDAVRTFPACDRVHAILSHTHASRGLA